jgi:hypothetical protein
MPADIKCPHCFKEGPTINSRLLKWPNGLVAAIFSCAACKWIISISVVPQMDVQLNSAIVKPTAAEVSKVT